MKHDCTKCSRLECPFKSFKRTYLEFRLSLNLTAPQLEFHFAPRANTTL